MWSLLKLEEVVSPFVGERRYILFLCSLIALTALGPLVEHTFWARTIVGGCVALVLLFGALSVSASKKMKIFAHALAAVACVAWLLAFGFNVHFLSSDICQIASYMLILAYLITVCLLIRRDIYSGTITANRVVGAVCVFILIGFCFSIIHMVISITDPTSYTSTIEDDHVIVHKTNEHRFPLYVYFSFCTLTTLGYGDVIPSSRLSRTVSWLEALSGQLYLTVMMARLVGMHVANIDTTPRDEY